MKTYYFPNHLFRALYFAAMLLGALQTNSQGYILPGDTNYAQVAARNGTLTPDSIWESSYNRYKRFEDFIDQAVLRSCK
jgi:hypothetical protein